MRTQQSQNPRYQDYLGLKVRCGYMVELQQALSICMVANLCIQEQDEKLRNGHKLEVIKKWS